jgi:enoyl-CoA hydratase/carnithine racemase
MTAAAWRETACDGLVIAHPAGGTLSVRLTRPERRNAISEAMFEVLGHAAHSAGADPALRVLVLESAVAGTFCAGADVATMADPAPAVLRRHFDALDRCVEALRASPIPVLAIVDGACLGAGCALVAASDLAVATEDSKFALPEIGLGLAPVLAMKALAPVVPRRALVAWAATGLPFDAEEARAAGLVTMVVPKADLDATRERLIDRLQVTPRDALATIKRTAARLHTGLEHANAEALMEDMLATATAPPARAAIERFLARERRA